MRVPSVWMRSSKLLLGVGEVSVGRRLVRGNVGVGGEGRGGVGWGVESLEAGEVVRKGEVGGMVRERCGG